MADDPVFLITGASSGIGAETARQAIDAGYRVVLAARREQELARLDMERRLAVLGTLGNNAPFIGLLGTVIGIVRAFRAGGAVFDPAPPSPKGRRGCGCRDRRNP